MTISDFIDDRFTEAAKEIDWSSVITDETTLKWTDASSNLLQVDSYLRMTDEGYKDLARKLEKFLAPAEVIVKCGHCGQWGAVKTQCKHCGAAVG